MRECKFDWHAPEGELIDHPGGSQEARTFCAICGVGFSVFFSPAGPRSVSLRLEIFPADGDTMISRDVIRWALASYQRTIQDMETDGFHVIQEPDYIKGKPVGL